MILITLKSFYFEEIEEIISLGDTNKSQGSDGYNLGVFKSCWEILKNDVVSFINEFHGNAKVPKYVTAYFLALIPKCDNPQILYVFRLIYLVGSLYRIIAKLLASRVKRVLGKLINKCQLTFLANKQMLGGILVVNELFDFPKRNKIEFLLEKVDFANAYNCVSWNYFKYVMRRIGFGLKWLD